MSSDGPAPPEDARAALEQAFYDWWADNHHALSLGAAGDVLDLRFRLNDAFANSSSFSGVESIAS